MTDILIRDVPDEVLAAIDANAKRVGLSLCEYLRRTLERARVRRVGPVTVDQLERAAADATVRRRTLDRDTRGDTLRHTLARRSR